MRWIGRRWVRERDRKCSTCNIKWHIRLQTGTFYVVRTNLNLLCTDCLGKKNENYGKDGRRRPHYWNEDGKRIYVHCLVALANLAKTWKWLMWLGFRGVKLLKMRVGACQFRDYCLLSFTLLNFPSFFWISLNFGYECSRGIQRNFY